jgi:hypothetical protein
MWAMGPPKLVIPSFRKAIGTSLGEPVRRFLALGWFMEIVTGCALFKRLDAST